MEHRIADVEVNSIAMQLGIQKGDFLLKINGKDVIDTIDYETFTAESHIDLLIRHGDAETEFSFDKDEYEPLGLMFEKEFMTGIRNCANHCIFCFEDQNRPGARSSLSSRDDDWRLSLMTGSYVTLTNVGDRELQRIIDRKASPLYISVQTMDGELRTRMLNNKRAALIGEQLKKLAEGGIRFHTQAVICPGYNDGEKLEETIHDLLALQPNALSLAVVPVGLTQFRDGLTPLRLMTKEEARDTIGIIRKWQAIAMQYYDTPFVYGADELYLAADMPLPPAEDYGDFSQIENGIGMLRLLEEEYVSAHMAEFPKGAKKTENGRKLLIATGLAAGAFIRKLLDEHPVPGVDVEVRMLENTWFGPTVNTAGLLTGHELLRKENGLAESEAEEIWITEMMLREGEDIFLDDRTVPEVAQLLGKKITIVPRGGDALLDMLVEFSQNND